MPFDTAPTRPTCRPGERLVAGRVQPGMTYGHWTVTKTDQTRPGTHVVCKCSCGTERAVQARSLARGSTRSCGCQIAIANRARCTRHAGHGTRLYRIWSHMLRRCDDHSNANYGGRGIEVIPEWRDFATFRTWALANGYADELSIDRIDVDLGYAPANCRWATQREQTINTRRARRDAKGRPWTEIAAEHGISADNVSERLRRGWTPEQAATTPLDPRFAKPVAEPQPGQRVVAGRLHTFDLDLFNLHKAHQTVLAAPADLSGLTYDEVTTLQLAAFTVLRSSRSDWLALPCKLDMAAADEVATRASDERAARPEYQAVFGKVA